MKKLRDMIGSIHRFDSVRYDFSGLFLKWFNEFLAVKGHAPINDVVDLHERTNREQAFGIHEFVYTKMHQPEFEDMYHEFMVNEILPKFEEEGYVYFQRNPSWRVQLPHSTTSSYHSDDWFGHKEDMVNFWLPITPVAESSTIYVATDEDSLQAVDRLEKEKATVPELNLALATISRPKQLEVGEYCIFGAQTIHGTETNVTGKTRVSIDFRLLKRPDPPGNKVIGVPHTYYWTKEDLNKVKSEPIETATLPGCSYPLCKYGFAKCVPPMYQRLVIREYAANHGIDLVISEAEVQTMSHHPVLWSLAARERNRPIDAVVLFSLLCLPEPAEDRLRILEKAAANNVVFHFANELTNMDHPDSIPMIEAEYQRLKRMPCEGLEA